MFARRARRRSPSVPAPRRPADAAPEEERRRRWPTITLGLLVLALIGLMAYAFTRPEKSDVPKVTSLQLSDARERLDRAGFENVEVERERSFARGRPGAAPGPRPGRAGGEGRRDHADRLGGARPGAGAIGEEHPHELAIRELEKAELKVTADPQPSDTVKKGFAIGTSPEEGTEVERGSRVRLFVSSGPEQVTVPTWWASRARRPRRASHARASIRAWRREQSDEPEDEVIAQTPGAGHEARRRRRASRSRSPRAGSRSTCPTWSG